MADIDEQPEWELVPAVRVGDLVIFSGVVGVSDDGTVPSDPETQFRAAFASLGRELETQGLTPAHLVDLNSFHIDFPDHMAAFSRVKKAFLGETQTAWTAIGAAKLGYPGLIVEIKAFARAK